MIQLRPFYEEDLLESEQYLAMREYWDDIGDEWRNMSIEKKIIMMGRFLLHGGKLEDVLERYKDGRDEMYIRRIRSSIYRYLGILLINGIIDTHSPLHDELESLSDEELIGKFSKLLLEKVKETEDRDASGRLICNYEIV